MGKHINVIYSIRCIGTYQQIYVKTHNENILELSFFQQSADGAAVLVYRKDARLLAKRINQCLDETLSKTKKKENK